MRCALVLFTKKDAEGFHIHFGLVEWVVGRGDVDVVLYEDFMGTFCVSVAAQGGRAEVEPRPARHQVQEVPHPGVLRPALPLEDA